ncbi:MAG TPA: hypothetical protein VKC63_09175 [Solirubrobacterales bacterium]|nr:hypothetical protein [Solirubrobacterales bacterium]
MTDVSIPPASQTETAPSQPGLAPVPREPEPPATQIQTSAVQGGDQCASCGALLAVDQRYCLECGQRRGDPRLPFMDAVVLMDAVQRPAQAPPPPPKKKRTGISPNAALIAGVGTLLLALGIGVLIGRSGHQEVAQTAATPQIIKVGGSGGEESATASKGKTTTGGGAAANAKTKKQKAAALKAAEAHPAAEEVIKPTNGVKLAPPKTQVGDPCSNSEAGCENGKFEGTFFE